MYFKYTTYINHVCKSVYALPVTLSKWDLLRLEGFVINSAGVCEPGMLTACCTINVGWPIFNSFEEGKEVNLNILGWDEFWSGPPFWPLTEPLSCGLNGISCLRNNALYKWFGKI